MMAAKVENGSNIRKIDVKTPDGKVDGTIELPAELFDAPANIEIGRAHV